LDKLIQQRKIFEEIIVENFPNMGKEIATQLQEAQSPIQDKPRRNTLRNIVVKLTKIKNKEKLLKADRSHLGSQIKPQ
uniref:L1 transposable element RRM domain-containing protein n=1 Tax=Monodon monoceros TaxID=40151 RepID=A0A8C6F2G6_MONMO